MSEGKQRVYRIGQFFNSTHAQVIEHVPKKSLVFLGKKDLAVKSGWFQKNSR